MEQGHHEAGVCSQHAHLHFHWHVSVPVCVWVSVASVSCAGEGGQRPVCCHGPLLPMDVAFGLAILLCDFVLLPGMTALLCTHPGLFKKSAFPHLFVSGLLCWSEFVYLNLTLMGSL